MANRRDEEGKSKEEEYFYRKEMEAKEKNRERLAAAQKESLKQAFFMRCPKCGESLEEINFQEIQVDRCTGCRGVWLDPGELERLSSKEKEGWLARFRGSTQR